MLHLHRAERTDALVAGLAELLARPPSDAFDVEIVSVPTRGVERWLTQRLSHVLGTSADSHVPATDGICARVEFPSPAELTLKAIGHDPEAEPWRPARLSWTVLAVLDEALEAGETWTAHLAGYLGDSSAERIDRGRRAALSQHMARLFDSYANSRPTLLAEWESGHWPDADVPPDLAWQPPLWRAVAEKIGTPNPATQVAQACEQLRAFPGAVDLPARLSVFGPTRLATSDLLVLDALATGRDVHLWLAHPSHALWNRLRALAETAQAPRLLGNKGLKAPLPRNLDSSAAQVRNPLLASLGRDSRELQIQLARLTDIGADTYHSPLQALPDSALGRLQAAIANDEAFEPSPGQTRTAPAQLVPGDRSITVHSCHGPARQVEVLRDLITGLLADDPTLEPRDVLVMCPDIENYAPLVSAAFGLAPDTGSQPTGPAAALHPGHRLRVRLADRSLRQTNPLLSVVSSLLEFADSRHTATELLEFAARPPVRARFDFSDDDLAAVTDWVQRSGLRWGFHASDRRRYGITAMHENTWRTGLDRVLVGTAVAEDGRFVDTALPLTGLDSSDIDLSGRLAELVRRLTTVTARLTQPQPLAGWVDSLLMALDLLTSVSGDDAWQSLQARGRLSRVVDQAGDTAETAVLSLTDIRAVLGNIIAGSPTRANFRTGHLTMCSLVPMRSVPHRVICILGLDDGQFPRRDQLDGDDLLRQLPAVGDRNRRQEDRQLLLDAVLAARDHLVFFYSGADPRTNALRPPAVPLGEMLDAIDATSQLPGGALARTALVTVHPLQSFDVRNFMASPTLGDKAFSFDPGAFKAAQRSRSRRVAPPPFLAAPFAPLSSERTADVNLGDLADLLVHPARGFLRQRLGVRLDADDDIVTDGVPVALDGLATWGVRDRVLADALALESVPAAEQIELRRGLLPPAKLGEAVLHQSRGDIVNLTAVFASLKSLTDESSADAASPRLFYSDLDVEIDLTVPERATPSGVQTARQVRLVGTVPRVSGGQLIRVHAGRVRASHRLRIWVELLALSASGQLSPGAGAALFGRRERAGGLVSIPIIAPGDGDPEVARAVLTDLLNVYLSGLQSPLPLPASTSYAYADARSRNVAVADARAAADRVWVHQPNGNSPVPGESYDREWQLVHGARATLAELAAEEPWPAEQGGEWSMGETRRFGRLATRIWYPIIASTQPGLTL